MKLRVLKSIDRLVGKLIVRNMTPSFQRAAMRPRSFLFIRPGGIGDAALSVSCLVELKRVYPESSIAVLAEKRNAAVYNLCTAVNELYLYDKPRELFKVMRGKFDVVIDSEQWHRLSAVVARMTGASISVGYASNERRKLFSHPVPYSLNDYEVDSFFHLLGLFDVSAKREDSPYLTIPEEAARKARVLLGDFEQKPFVAIFPGSSIPEKRWDTRKFAKLAMKLNLSGLSTVIIGGKKEVKTGGAIINGFDGLNLTGKTSLVETAAVIDRALVVVSGDSGVLHLATGLGRPTVSLFGPSNVRKWAPRGQQHIVISKNLPCSPCSKYSYTPQCPINAKCMSEITVEEVYAAVEKLVKIGHK